MVFAGRWDGPEGAGQPPRECFWVKDIVGDRIWLLRDSLSLGRPRDDTGARPRRRSSQAFQSVAFPPFEEDLAHLSPTSMLAMAAAAILGQQRLASPTRHPYD
jgi:hypothetical protein